MDFKQIEAFVNVAKYKSFSKAAESIFLSQPTISAHIASLEEELNISLFDRNGKDIRITEAGTLFLEYAINMINTRNSAFSQLLEYKNNISGKLTIAASTTPCRFLVPSLIKDFCREYKEITFDIKEDSTRNIMETILSGNADIGIAGGDIHDKRLSSYKICDDTLTLISNDPSLPDIITRDMLLKLPFILREKGSATRTTFENALRDNNINPARLRIFSEASSLESVIQLVKHGLGISAASEIACKDYLDTGLLRKHSLEGININRGIFLVIHNKRTLSPTAKAFFEKTTGIPYEMP